jgi:hypothetical protein
MNQIILLIGFIFLSFASRKLILELIKTKKEKAVFEEIYATKKAIKHSPANREILKKHLLELRISNWKFALKRMGVNYIVLGGFAGLLFLWFKEVHLAILWYILGIIILSIFSKVVLKWE